MAGRFKTAVGSGVWSSCSAGTYSAETAVVGSRTNKTCGVGKCGVGDTGFVCMMDMYVGTAYVFRYVNEKEYGKELSS